MTKHRQTPEMIHPTALNSRPSIVNRQSSIVNRRLFFICSLLSLIVVITFIPDTASSFIGISNARGAGMAGSFTAVARDVDAVRWNPANLALSDRDRTLSVNLFSLGFGVRNNAFSIGDYNDHAGKRITGADKAELLDKIPSEGFDLNLGLEARALNISYKSYAFITSVVGDVTMSAPKDLFDLLLSGNQFGRMYDIGDWAGEGWGIASVSFSGAHQLHLTALTPYFDELSVGGTFRYLRGIAYGRVVRSTGSLVTEDAGFRLSGTVLDRRAEGGSGVGLDIGAVGRMNQTTIGLSLINPIGRISWTKKTTADSAFFSADSLRVARLTEVEKFEDAFNFQQDDYPISSFTTSFPFLLRIGAMHRLPEKKLLIAGDYEQGFSKSAGTTTTPRIAVGGEYRPVNWIPLRLGLAFGGRSKIESAVGFGLGRRRAAFNFAVANRGSLFPGGGTNGVRMALGLTVGY